MPLDERIVYSEFSYVAEQEETHIPIHGFRFSTEITQLCECPIAQYMCHNSAFAARVHFHV